MSQQDFWPEEIKIRNVDRVDVFSLAEDDNILMLYHKLLEKSWTYNDIQEGKYFIYPTGGHNPFLPEKGKVFPYLFNEVTKKIIKPADRRNTLINVYPAWKLKTKKGTEKGKKRGNTNKGTPPTFKHVPHLLAGGRLSQTIRSANSLQARVVQRHGCGGAAR